MPYFNKNNNDYMEIFNMINFINKRDSDKTIFERSKISIKIRQLSKTHKEQQKILEEIVNYAYNKNVFIWISAVLPSDLHDEYHSYLNLIKKGYTNIGLTLATYHSSVSKKIDKILLQNGHIRLVKGYYYGDIKDWNIVTNLYYLNAKKLIQSNNYHTLATHDFNILNKLKKEDSIYFDKMELAFFYSYLDYAINNTKEFNNNKSLYLSYGNKLLYLFDNIHIIDLSGIIKRSIKNIFN
jgi:hypothetical protein